jgi:hypothetical protein
MKIGLNLHVCLLCLHIVNLVLLPVVTMEQWLKTFTIICRLSLKTMKKNNLYLMLHWTFNLKVEASIKVAKISFSANILIEWKNGCDSILQDYYTMTHFLTIVPSSNIIRWCSLFTHIMDIIVAQDSYFQL